MSTRASTRWTRAFTVAALGVALAPACASSPSPGPATASSSAPPPADDPAACAKRRARRASCGSSPADAEVLEAICGSERGCLAPLWTPDAIARYRACEASGGCGVDCRGEAARGVTPSPAWQRVFERCKAACGKDGDSTCASVLGPQRTFRDAALDGADACVDPKDCFATIACIGASTTDKTARLGTCLGAAALAACSGKSDAPLCRRAAELMKK